MQTQLLVVVVATAGIVYGSSSAGAVSTWSRVGSTMIDLNLAGPAGGPISDVGFLPDGTVLYVRTATGHVWQSFNQGKTWVRGMQSLQVDDPFASPPVSDPNIEPPADDLTSKVVRHPFRGSEWFALGFNLHHSMDAGRTWVNLTGDELGSIIGSRQTSIAFSPTIPDAIVVGNVCGVWRSTDNGLTWNGLNQNLPNFPTGKLLYPPTSDRFLGFYAYGVGALETNGLAGSEWLEAVSSTVPMSPENPTNFPSADIRRMAPFPLDAPTGLVLSYRVWIKGVPVTGDLTACGITDCDDPKRHYISAFASGEDGESFYVGTSDGLIWSSDDSGSTWHQSSAGLPNRGTVVSLFAHPDRPEAAIAIFDHESSGKIFRTTSGGAFWDDVTGDLPAGRIFALTVDLSSGVAYVAGERGVFYTIADLLKPTETKPWRSVGELPATVKDILLDEAARQLYVLVDGYGVFTARAPAVPGTFRIANAADLTRRSAAPGSLLTIFGETLERVDIAGIPAPILFSSETETQVQVPYEVRERSITLKVTTELGTHVMSYPLAMVSPAIFVDRGSPLVLDGATGQLLSAMNPAVASSRIIILATGLGAVKPMWPTGVPSPVETPPKTVKPAKAYLNGIALRVNSSTLAPGYIGTYLVEIEMPSFFVKGIAELSLEVNGVKSNKVRIYTEP